MMKASLIHPVRKENGFKVFNENSNESLSKFSPRMVKIAPTPNFLLQNSSLLLKRLSTLSSIKTMKPLAEHVTSASACHSNI